MRIFGLDAGFTSFGASVVETSSDNPIGKVIHMEAFVPAIDKKIKNASGVTALNVNRIEQITARLIELDSKFLPDLYAVEYPAGGAASAGAIRGMAYAVGSTAAILKAIRILSRREFEIVHVTPIGNKKGSTGKIKWDVPIEQGKWEVMNAVMGIWPGLDWPKKKGKKSHEYADGLCWAIADSLSCVATYLRSKGDITSVHQT